LGSTCAGVKEAQCFGLAGFGPEQVLATKEGDHVGIVGLSMLFFCKRGRVRIKLALYE